MSEPPAKSSGSLEALLDESRRFPPPERFQKHANQNDLGIYERAGSDVEAFWAEHPPEKYRAGEWGPHKADDMLARDGRVWRRP